MKILSKHSQEFKVSLSKEEFEEISTFINYENRVFYACPLYKDIATSIMNHSTEIKEMEIHNIFQIDETYEFNVVATVFKEIN